MQCYSRQTTATIAVPDAQVERTTRTNVRATVERVVERGRL